MSILNVDYMLGLFPILVSYLPLTLGMAAAGMVMALMLSCCLAVIRVLRLPILNGLTKLFISFFRGTPLLVQLFLFYYGFPKLIADMAGVSVTILGHTTILPMWLEDATEISAITAAIIGLTLHFSAYMAESIRAAIVGVDRSQTEAALSIGMTNGQLMRRIVLPQATRIAVPTLMNYFIDMIKATSLAFALGVTELMGATQKEAASSFNYFEAFITAAVLYWAVVELLAWVQRRLESRLNEAYRR
ncbi:amino acid ABC transporter permease [Halomonas binhaiensis]|uniref:Amino acid ABC transporter permease n=1 Tax=Halomonas binhaiensis TaxID=2562282 RepID=A0A5C1NGJ7_9GAMM|nr:amino acid ABC transporter permease [Halomonas binhaiensis]QEM82366.1 amino acid ABC transporter permease [Halomonas binhaiensis]